MPLRFARPAGSAYQYPLLVRHLLHTPLATAPLQEIVYRDRSRYTYRILDERIGRLAAGLARCGVEQGTPVAVMEWDSHRYLECFFAIPMLGAVLQTVNIRLTSAQIQYTLNHTRAEVLLIHRDFLSLLHELRPHLPHVRTVILLCDDEMEPVPSWIDMEYEALIRSSDSGFPFRDFDENAIATTFYTTGTTGDPKGVCFSHRQIVLHTLAVLGAAASPAHGQSFRHGDVYMPMTPMFHVHAWGNPYVATLLGVKQVYPGRYIPDELLSLREREGVTYSHCVPTILRMLLAAARSRDVDLAGWKICIGGSALTVGLAREALSRGIDVYAGYGMSETGPVIAIARLTEAFSSVSSEEAMEQRCKAGMPIPLVDIKLIDSNGREMPWDGVSVGEIVIRAPWTTPCYADNAVASEELWRGGYLHTQDVGSINGQGFIKISDRIKDVIKTGGEWLSSLEIESIISGHPGVAEVAVVAVQDVRWGERPHALVVPREEYRSVLAARDIQEHVAAAAASGCIPKYAVPERVTFVDSLARTSVGKIDKLALRERYG
ncbi:MAG TPA: long-chain-fatty-acid--CoA ligase [Steroidobacteraceae bacterium]|nr:long-chain-fatty-acid--CoA ligase [Steroidobacteraceae bacterium]